MTSSISPGEFIAFSIVASEKAPIQLPERPSEFAFSNIICAAAPAWCLMYFFARLSKSLFAWVSLEVITMT